jgi:hypothetical protein
MISPLRTFNGDLKREFHGESPHTNNRKMIYNQKVHIFNEPVNIYMILYYDARLVYSNGSMQQYCTSSYTLECQIRKLSRVSWN